MSGTKMRQGQRLARELRDQGWRVVKGRHFKAYCPCGEHMLVFATTGGGGRGNANIRSLADRYLRECAVNLGRGQS